MNVSDHKCRTLIFGLHTSQREKDLAMDLLEARDAIRRMRENLNRIIKQANFLIRAIETIDTKKGA